MDFVIHRGSGNQLPKDTEGRLSTYQTQEKWESSQKLYTGSSLVPHGKDCLSSNEQPASTARNSLRTELDKHTTDGLMTKQTYALGLVL